MQSTAKNPEGLEEREYWLVRVLRFLGRLLVAAFIHSTP
jgi:hypothetical protein